ncbi:hypothetical protein RA280_43340 [Cupriavidus sp. CV2]|uniref:hypothetical protein n=1 Tax=Cupriavidus ulmosensis TaxID=3065913 RepID=UPI00296ACE84|nr:hypothetical protein [Cupriavidus sp. CV2]MDW3688448.1 hypothetical protein [Cupriavidus sp. CV2]
MIFYPVMSSVVAFELAIGRLVELSRGHRFVSEVIAVLQNRPSHPRIRAGLAYLHATVYRGLSFIASHATMSSTNALFEPRSEGNVQMVFGPSTNGIDFCLGLIDTCLAKGAPRFEKLFDPMVAPTTNV